MCGIAGLYSLADRAVEPFDVVRMCDAQAHRGPDDAGYVLLAPLGGAKGARWREVAARDRPCAVPGMEAPGALSGAETLKTHRAYRLALGHRRLSILDLSVAGHQPMANRAKSLWLVYNGEIYNYLELKKELIGKGYSFQSGTDTEVLLHLYEEYGVAFVERLNGMFAFALWDDRGETLLLARDRYGVKPLYYAEIGQKLVFASEVKAILAVPDAPRGVDLRSLTDYFTFQNTFGDATLFKGIRMLEPGHLFLVKGSRVEHRRYWDFQFEPMCDTGEERCRERLRYLLEDTVKRQLNSDVSVGAYLSGGMDSGSITAMAATSSPRLMTFTGGFDLTNVSGFEAGFDEREDAEVLSALFGTEHYQMVFHAGDLEWALPRVIWAIEDLRVGMCYPYYYTARLASRFVKVVLAGTGGDEIFAGYPWRYRVAEGAASPQEFLARYYRYWNRLVPAQQQAEFFSPDVLSGSGRHDPYESFLRVASPAASIEDPIRRALYVEAKTFLHGLLVVEDKLSMAHSLESRVPLLDHALVDFVTTIPTRYLVNYRWEKNPSGDENLAGKYLFRRAMEGVLPDRILLKRKQGFSAPEQSWYQGPLMNYVKTILLDRTTLSRGFFQEAFIRRTLDEHLTGRVNHRLLIWSLLSFEYWNRLFMDADGAARYEGAVRP